MLLISMRNVTKIFTVYISDMINEKSIFSDYWPFLKIFAMQIQYLCDVGILYFRNIFNVKPVFVLHCWFSGNISDALPIFLQNWILIWNILNVILQYCHFIGNISNKMTISRDFWHKLSPTLVCHWGYFWAEL